MSFESALKNGQFCIPFCSSCKRNIWPATEFCNQCFRKTSLHKENFEGKIIEFSRKNEEFFCVVEFEGEIRIVAKSFKKPDIGQKVKISKCGISNGNYYFHVNQILCKCKESQSLDQKSKQ